MPHFIDLIADLYVDDEEEELCLLLSPKARIEISDIEAHDVYRLDDGARVVHTATRGEEAFKAMRRELKTREAALRKSHADPRGVLAFRDGLLDDVRATADYEGAVTLVGKKGRWLCPKAG